MGSFGEILKDIGKSYVDSYKKKSEEYNSAYERGTEMDDYTLVKKWKNSRGPQLRGYCKALAERDLLYWDGERYHQTPEIRRILDNM